MAAHVADKIGQYVWPVPFRTALEYIMTKWRSSSSQGKHLGTFSHMLVMNLWGASHDSTCGCWYCGRASMCGEYLSWFHVYTQTMCNAPREGVCKQNTAHVAPPCVRAWVSSCAYLGRQLIIREWKSRRLKVCWREKCVWNSNLGLLHVHITWRIICCDGFILMRYVLPPQVTSMERVWVFSCLIPSICSGLLWWMIKGTEGFWHCFLWQ